MRLLRASRIAKRWETRMSIDYAMLSIAKCIIGVLVAAHWMACVWVLQVCTDPPAPPPQLHTGIGSRHLTSTPKTHSPHNGHSSHLALSCCHAGVPRPRSFDLVAW
jgi:nitrate reductase NapE component